MRFAPLLALLVAAPLHAVTLSFDDGTVDAAGALAPDAYADRGVALEATDDGLRVAGRSQGDPGAWGLEGRNGPAFLGFNGASYALAASFDGPVRGLRLDVASSRGATPGALFTVAGYRDGRLVEQETVELGGVDEWVTAGLDAEIDRLEWWGSDDRFHPFGVDNLRWIPADQEPFEVDLEVRPGTTTPLDPKAGGVVGAILFGDARFDVAEIDTTTLAVGPDGAAVAHPATVHVQDVDDDGLLDLVALYRLDETGIGPTDEDVCVTGETLTGEPFEGCIELLVVGAAD